MAADHQTLLLRLAKARVKKEKKRLRKLNKLRKRGLAPKKAMGTSLDKSGTAVLNRKGGTRVVGKQKKLPSGKMQNVRVRGKLAHEIKKRTGAAADEARARAAEKQAARKAKRAKGPSEATKAQHARAQARARERAVKTPTNAPQRRMAAAAQKEAVDQHRAKHAGNLGFAPSGLTPFTN